MQVPTVCFCLKVLLNQDNLRFLTFHVGITLYHCLKSPSVIVKLLRVNCCCNYTFVYDIFRSRLTFQQAFLFFSTVTIFCLYVFSIDQLLLWDMMMEKNNNIIGSTEITDFYSMSIAYFVQLVICLEIFICKV